LVRFQRERAVGGKNVRVGFQSHIGPISTIYAS